MAVRARMLEFHYDRATQFLNIAIEVDGYTIYHKGAGKIENAIPCIDCHSLLLLHQTYSTKSKKSHRGSSRMKPLAAEVLPKNQPSKYIAVPLMTSTPLLPLLPYQGKNEREEKKTNRKYCSSLFKDSEEWNIENTLHEAMLDSVSSENPLEVRTSSSKSYKKPNVCNSSIAQDNEYNRSAKVMLMRKNEKIKTVLWGKKGKVVIGKGREGGQGRRGRRKGRRGRRGGGYTEGGVRDEIGERIEVSGINTSRIREKTEGTKEPGRETHQRRCKNTREKAGSKTRIGKSGNDNIVNYFNSKSQCKKKTPASGDSVQTHTSRTATTSSAGKKIKGKEDVVATGPRAAYSTTFCPPSTPLAFHQDYHSVPICPTLTQQHPPTRTSSSNCKFLPFPGMDQLPLDNLTSFK